MVLEATFPKLGGGGAESQVLTLGQRLARQGVHVRIVVPMVRDGPQVARETLEGLEVVRLRYPRIPLVGGAIMLMRLAWLLAATRGRYSIIHAHIAHNMAAVAALAGRLLGKRVIVKITGLREMAGGILDPHPPLASRLRRIAIRQSTLVQATSSRIGKLLVASGFAPSSVLLLPNGVDVQRFAGLARDAALRERLCGDSALVGIFVGRLAPEKGHEMLIECWAASFRAVPGAKLLLVGDGPMRTRLEERARRLGIEGQVIFAGHRDDVAPMLAIADFALLTSTAEGLSNALLEYMSAALPVVGTRVSGTEDFVGPATGWLFEPGDAGQLASCLAEVGRMDRDALKAMGERARERVVETASLEAVTAALLSSYGWAPGAPRP
jgi:glycosyltransferase involved in cell wall biosynthesis